MGACNRAKCRVKLRRSLHAIASCCAMFGRVNTLMARRSFYFARHTHRCHRHASASAAFRILSAFSPTPTNPSLEFRKSLLACTRSTTCKTALQPVRPRCNDCNVTTSQHCTLDSVCRSACAWRSNAHAAQLSMSFSCNLCCGHCLDLFSLATMQHGVRTGGCGGCRRGVCSA
jgi:hypothetical protein